MPSLHLAVAVAVAMGAWRALPGRWRYLALLWPVLVTLTVVATANHYFLDVAAGVFLSVVCGVVNRHATKAAPWLAR